MLLMKMEDQLATPSDQSGTEVSPEEKAGTQTQETPAVTQAILEQLGLEANDAKVIDILRDKTNPIEQVAAFATLALENASAQQTPPKPAQVMPSADGGTTIETIDSLTEELSELQKSPVKNIKRMKEISAKLKEQLPRG